MVFIVSDLAPASPASVALVVICLGIALGSFIYLPRLLYPQPLPGIPYNESAASSVLGDIPALLTSPNKGLWFSNEARKHNSPVFQVFVKLLGRPWIVVADYAEASDICIRRVSEFDRSDMTAANFEGTIPGHHITLKTYDPRFKQNKELIRDLMGPKFLREVSAPKMYDRILALGDLWARKSAISKELSFDASEDIHHAALDIMLAIAFGLGQDPAQLADNTSLKVDTSKSRDTGVCEFQPIPAPPEYEAFDSLGNSIKIAISSPFPKLHHFLYRNLSRKMRRAIKESQRLIKIQTEKSLDWSESHDLDDSALSNVLGREKALADKEERKPDFHSQTIRSELLGYLIAGHETTSSALRWITKYLSAHPAIQSRLRKALRQAYAVARQQDRNPTLQEILSPTFPVPYLDAVVEEIIRHASPLPMVFRQATVDTEVFNTPITKGTVVAMLVGGPGITTPAIPLPEKNCTPERLTRTREVKPFDNEDIEMFKPERWLTTVKHEDGREAIVFDQESGPTQAFGLGPRSCFGRKLAHLEMRIYITLLIWNFELLPVKGAMGGFEEEPFLTKVPKHTFVRLRNVL